MAPPIPSPPAVPASLRTVVQAVAAATAPVSRADVAVATGLTKATVSAQVERLLLAGVLAEGPPRPRAGAGRPAVGLSLSGLRWAALGVQVGVDFLAGTVRDLSGRVRHRVVHPSASREPDDVLSAAAGLVTRLADVAAAQGLRSLGLGIAVPGLVSGGVVRLAPNLGWADVDVAGRLDDVVLVDNEATLAAVAECGYPRPVEDLFGAGVLVVTGEVGIGSGAVLDGALLRGSRGWSGELGHVCVDPGGAVCGCGARGCLETVAGQEPLLRSAGLDPRPGTALGGPHPDRSPVGALVDAAAAGAPGALAALDAAAGALGLAVSAAVNLLDVDVVVLGGIYADLAPWLLSGVQAEVASRALRARLRPVLVRASTVGPDAAVLGATSAVLSAALTDPERLLG